MSLKAILSFNNLAPETINGVGKFITRAVGKSILLAERNIKVLTPVKHGYLKRSIISKMTSDFNGEIFTNPVGTVTKKTSNKKGIAEHKDVNYAVYVEYGTRHMAPRAMFRKGIAQSEDGIKEIFSEEAKNMLK